MYKIFYEAHSGIAYLVLLGILLSTLYYFILFTGKKQLNSKSKTLALITMIFVHLQFLVGLVLYFVSPIVQQGLKDFGASMSDSATRLRLLEHPIVMLLVVILITLAHKKVKTASLNGSALKITTPLFYLFALVLALSRIPWDTWLS